MTKIFISHSNQDNEFVRQLAQALIDKGIDVWITNPTFAQARNGITPFNEG